METDLSVDPPESVSDDEVSMSDGGQFENKNTF